MCIHCAYTHVDRQVHGQTLAYTPYMGASNGMGWVAGFGMCDTLRTVTHKLSTVMTATAHVAPGPPGRSQNAAVVMLATATVHKRWTLPPQSHDHTRAAAVFVGVLCCAALYVCMHCMYVYGVNTLCQAPPP